MHDVTTAQDRNASAPIRCSDTLQAFLDRYGLSIEQLVPKIDAPRILPAIAANPSVVDHYAQHFEQTNHTKTLSPEFPLLSVTSGFWRHGAQRQATPETRHWIREQAERLSFVGSLWASAAHPQWQLLEKSSKDEREEGWRAIYQWQDHWILEYTDTEFHVAQEYWVYSIRPDPIETYGQTQQFLKEMLTRIYRPS